MSVPWHISTKPSYIERGVGRRTAGGNQDVHQVLGDPDGNVVADPTAHLGGAGDAGGQVEGPATLVGEVEGHAPQGPLEIGQGVAESVRLVLRQVKGVALPVQLDASQS